MTLKSLFLSLVVCILLASPSWASEFRITPGIGVSSEYNDNINEEREGVTDFITHIRPSMGMEYEGPRIEGSLEYSGDYQYFMAGKDEERLLHDLELETLFTVMKDRLFLEVTNTYSAVFEDSTRGEVQEGESQNNRVDQNTFAISPYTLFEIGRRGVLTTGYRFEDLRYIEDDDGSDRQQHRLFTDFDYALTDRMGLLTGYSFTDQDPEEGEGLIRHNAYLGSRYEFSETFSMFGQFGADYTEFDDGDDSVDPFWNVELKKAFDRLAITLSTSTRFSSDADSGGDLRETSYALTADWDLDRTRLYGGVRFSEFDSDGANNEIEETSNDSDRDSDSEADSTTFRPSIGLSHDLTERLLLTADTSMTIQDEEAGEVRRFFANCGLRYSFTEDVSASLHYRFKNAHSGRQDDENYTVNRVELGVDVTF